MAPNDTALPPDRPSPAGQGTGWAAAMLLRTERLARSGSFEIELPAGTLTLSPGLQALVGRGDSGDHLDSLAWIPPEERALIAGFWRHAAPGEPFAFQHRLITAEGQRLLVSHRGLLEALPDGGGRGVAVLQDITAQRDAERRIQELASQDSVTGLPGRTWLLDRLDAQMHAAQWAGHGLWVLAIQVPRITEVHARMGSAAGDTLAMTLAARLKESVGGETMAHLGESEFALVLSEAADAAAVRERALGLLRELEQPLRLGDTDIHPRALVGIAAWQGEGQDARELLEHAQAARRQAAAGEVALFHATASAHPRHDREIEAQLSQALARGEVTLLYQPQVDLSNGRVCGAEALLRWHSPALGEVPPTRFIPVAERCGIMGMLGDWVLEQACEQAAAWQQAGLPPLRLTVNLAAEQLQRPDLARQLGALMQRHGVPGERLGVEVTEAKLMADMQGATAVLGELKALGVEVSLDDFGTGAFSLNRLRTLPVDVIKIDCAFLQDITRAPQEASMSRAILLMAHGLQMQVLAEGVETEEQLALLSAQGCNRIQGFWFSPPVTMPALQALVRESPGLPERFLTHRRRTPTLLLVDDEENILSALKRLLRRDGYQIVTATSAAQALQRLAEQEVDVIVSDQRMPGMTGVEFLRRAKDIRPDTVRMVLSGYTELQSIIDAVNEGAIYKFLTKPWDDARLRAHVAEAFSHKDMADENRRLSRQVEAANTELAQANARLERMLQQQCSRAELLAANAGGMRDLLDGLPAAVLGVDTEGLVVYANREAEALLAPVDLIGRPATEVLPGAFDTGGLAPLSGVSVQLGTQRYSALCSSLQADGVPRGHLMLLLPQSRPAPVPTPTWAVSA